MHILNRINSIFLAVAWLLHAQVRHVVSAAQAPGIGRGLQQAELPVITPVRDITQFNMALASGAQHIELQNHIDFTGWSNSNDGIQQFIFNSVRSLRGNCSDPLPSGAALGVGAFVPPLLPQTPGQCLMFFGDIQKITITLRNREFRTRLWDLTFPQISSRGNLGGVLVENVYIRSVGSDNACMNTIGPVWMNNVTLQGVGEETPAALNVLGPVLAQDCKFGNWGTVDKSPIVLQGNQSHISFVGCVFESNNSTQPMIESRNGGEARLEGTLLDGTGAAMINRSPAPQQSGLFSDIARQVVIADTADTVPASPLEDAGSQFLVPNDPRVKRIQQDVEEAKCGGDCDSLIFAVEAGEPSSSGMLLRPTGAGSLTLALALLAWAAWA